MTKSRQSGVLDGDSAVTMARLMQIVGMPILLFMSWWMFNTLNAMSDRVARLEEKVGTAAEDRYRATQARSDFALRDEQLRVIMERLQNNEQRFLATGGRMNTLEDRLNRLDHLNSSAPQR